MVAAPGDDAGDRHAQRVAYAVPDTTHDAEGGARGGQLGARRVELLRRVSREDVLWPDL